MTGTTARWGCFCCCCHCFSLVYPYCGMFMCITAAGESKRDAIFFCLKFGLLTQGSGSCSKLARAAWKKEKDASVHVCVPKMKHDSGSWGAPKEAYRKNYSGEIRLNPCISYTVTSPQHTIIVPSFTLQVFLSHINCLSLTPLLLSLTQIKSEGGHIKLQLTCNHCSLLSGYRAVVQHIDIWMGRATLGVVTQDS